MSKPYEKLISFCEAEMINPTSKVAKVEDFGVGYTIRFPVLFTSIDIYKPVEADHIEQQSLALYGIEQNYRDGDRFAVVCEMLGLNSPWIPCTERLPETGGDVRVFGVDGLQRNSAAIDHTTSDGKVVWDDNYGYGCFLGTHWMPQIANPD